MKPLLPTARPGGFTIIELMVVVALIMIMTGLGVSGLGGNKDSQRLALGAELLSGAMNMARSTAISKSTYCEARIATDKTTDGKYRMFSVWEWNGDSEAWVQTRRWEMLPEGVTIDPGSPGVAASPQVTYLIADGPTTQPTQWKNQDIDTVYLRFSPTGQVTTALTSMQTRVGFRIVKGAVDASGGVRYLSTVGQSGYPANWREVQVDALTGRIRFVQPET